jgi:hypothetical protein
MHRENLDWAVQLIRIGGLPASCTTSVFISGTALLERQYASNVTWSQFLGTPLSSMGADRVSESRTVIRVVLLLEAAPASVTASNELNPTAANLRILIKPAPYQYRLSIRAPFWNGNLQTERPDFALHFDTLTGSAQ